MSAAVASLPPTNPLLRAATRPRKDMSVTQTYFLAHKACAKLAREAAQSDHDLRLLVGHANLLDSLMVELSEAEREQERWFNQSVRTAVTPKAPSAVARHVQWADRVEEPEEAYDGSDSSDSESDSSEDEEDYSDLPGVISAALAPVADQLAKDQAFDDNLFEEDDEEDFAQLQLTRTSSHSSPPLPELVDHDSDPSDDEAMPPSPPDLAPPFSEKAEAKAEAEAEKEAILQGYFTTCPLRTRAPPT